MSPIPRIVMLVTNDVTYDARVRKEAHSAAEAGFEVVVIGLRTPGTSAQEEWPVVGSPSILIRRVAKPLSGFGRNALVRKLKNYRGIKRIQRALAFAAIAEHPTIIHANDLDTLPSAIAAKAATNARVVYDAHELYTELFDRPDAGRLDQFLIAVQKRMLTRQEGSLIRKADSVVTVNPLIAAELSRRYGFSTPTVVLNAPAVQSVDALPLPEGPRPIFIYQGGLAPSRGLTMMVEAFATASTGSLVIMGSGPLREELAQRAAKPDLEDRVSILDPVSQPEVIRYAASADVGLIPYQPESLNNLYASPNKLFDYLHAGIAIIATDLPYIRVILEDTGAGVVVPSADVEALAEAMRSLASDSARLGSLKSHAKQSAARFSWPNEVGKLIAEYERLAESPTETAAASD